MQLQWQRFIGLCTSLKELYKSHLLFWVATNTTEKDRLGFKRDRYDLKGRRFYCSEINWGNSLQIKNPLKGSIIFGRKKNKISSEENSWKQEALGLSSCWLWFHRIPISWKGKETDFSCAFFQQKEEKALWIVSNTIQKTTLPPIIQTLTMKWKKRNDHRCKQQLKNSALQ